MASRPGSKAASRSATHFGWGVTCTDIGSPPRALELLGKKGLARAPNVAPRSPCTSSCGLTTCASDNKLAVSVITPSRFRPIDTIYRPAISSRYIVNLGAKHDSAVRLERVRLRVRSQGILGRTARGRPTPPVVRIRGHEVRDPQTPERQAASRLRSDERAGRPDARLLFPVAGHRISHAAVARGRRPRRRTGGGGQEGLRDHGHGARVSRGAPRYGGRHLRPRARGGGPRARRRDGRRDSLARPAGAGGVP